MSKTVTIKKKLFVAYTRLIVAVILAFAIFLFAYISRILSSQNSDMMTSLLTAGINQTDMEVRRIDTISLNISYSELVKGNFEKLIHQKSKMYSSDQKTRAIIDALVAINGPLLPVQQINIYSMDGQVLSTGFTNKPVKTTLEEKEWYEPTTALEGKKYLFPLKSGKDAYIFYDAETSKTKYTALNRMLFNKYGQNIGVLEVITKSNQIFKSINEMKSKYQESVKAYIFDDTGKMIYPYTEKEELMIDYQTIVENQKYAGNGFFKLKKEGSQYNVYYKQSAYTGWTLILAQSQESVIRPVITLAIFMLLITSIFIGVALLSSLKIARDLSNPIKELLMTIKNTRLKNLGKVKDHKVTTEISEIEELDGAFSEMRINLKHSTEALLEAQRQELKARMLALQSQMNPHFLYNTLTNISVMAEEGLSEGIVEMCEHVSFLLRYFSLSKPSLVKVSEEFECSKKYLSIVKIRYKDYLKYAVTMDERLEAVKIPRNIIQPLVENAAKYGMNEAMLWDIKVEGVLEKAGWRIKVSDKGFGFSEEKLASLREKIDKINKHKEYLDLEINGMGFINVYSRLKLTYEDKMFFEFRNDENGGAVVVIGADDLENKE